MLSVSGGTPPQGSEYGSRADAIHGLWAYCRQHNLVDGADSSDIKCTEALHKLFTTARDASRLRAFSSRLAVCVLDCRGAQ